MAAINGADRMGRQPLVLAEALHIGGHLPQQHDGHHDGVLGDGDTVGVGVSQKTVGVSEKAVVLAVDVHSGRSGAVPLQRSGGGPEQVRGPA